MEDIIGKKIGRLTVLRDSGERAHNKEIIYTCECECGTIKNIRSSNLRSGKTKSCGCARHSSASSSEREIIKRVVLDLRGYDADIYEKLESVRNTSAYIKQLIRADIKNNQ